MPELPEVETVRQTLAKQLTGERISAVDVFYEAIIKEITIGDFKKRLSGESVTKFNRYGKYLVISFNTISLIVHLRMEGKFFIKTLAEPREKHEHIIFTLASGKTLRYHDVRKFGTFYLVASTDDIEILKHPSLAKLAKDGNDIWKEDELMHKLKNKTVPVKTALLDQTVMAGLGNIYANEVLFLSGIHPLERSCRITKKQATLLCRNAKKVLDEAITQGGTTIHSYQSALGVSGRFQQFLLVHGRKDQPCSICQTPLKKMRVGGRGTYFCPSCQPQRTVIGITGGIATGKTLVAEALKRWGYPVFEADSFVKELYQNEEIINQIAALAPSSYRCGQIDKKYLGELLYEFDYIKSGLENIFHPLVWEKVLDFIGSNTGKIFLDIPLLFEARFDKLCDYTIVVYVDELTNRQRLMARDQIDAQYASKKIAGQLPLAQKIKRASFVLDNNGTKDETIVLLQNILKKIG